MTAKEHVQNLLARLPEECTLDEIQYHLHVYRKVQNGLEQAERGQVVAHEDVVRRMKEKWAKR